MRGPISARWRLLAAALLGSVLVLLLLMPSQVPEHRPPEGQIYEPIPGGPRAAGGPVAPSRSGEPALGADVEDEGADPGSPSKASPPLPQFTPRQIHCVGSPPRQTEDPLSPPCVAFFEGDNGGSTHRGVSEDDISVVFYSDHCCEGDLTKPWHPTDECVGCGNIVRTVKAHLRYFQKRLQTYGRLVRLVGQKARVGLAGEPTCASRRADAQAAVLEHQPFAAVWIANGNIRCYADQMAKMGVLTFGLNEDVPSALYEDDGSISYGFMPTQELQTRWSASFVCRALDGGTARFAKDTTMRSRTRTFAFVRPGSPTAVDVERYEEAELFQRYLEDECDPDLTVETYERPEEAATIAWNLRLEEITTVICYCVPSDANPGGMAGPILRASTSLAYFPEWYWDASTLMDRAFAMRAENGALEHASFGTTYLWRQSGFREQYHYQAYLQEEPGTQPNPYYNFGIYTTFLTLFRGVQSAGPNITPETLRRGLFTFSYTDRRNPWVPTGGFGPDPHGTDSEHTFVDTGMAWWWDPTGRPPGEVRASGCMRAPFGGLRFYPSEWPRGDGYLFRPADVCTDDLYKPG